MHQLKSCGFLIVRGNPIDDFLLMIHPDRLDLPKGHVDPGETEMECALRELVEETGITRQDIHIHADYRFELKYIIHPKRTNFEKTEKTLVIFLATLIRDVEIALTEHEGYEWREWSPPHVIQQQTIDPLLAHLEAYLNNQQS